VMERKHLPEVRCIYFVLSPEGAVLYIGQTSNLRRRWIAHHRFANLADCQEVRIVWMATDDADIASVERALIERYHPSMNGAYYIAGTVVDKAAEPTTNVSVNIRVPVDLRDALAAYARRENRSLGGTVAWLVKRETGRTLAQILAGAMEPSRPR
jgi:hypothetical protein